MKVAALQYQYAFPKNFEAYQDKITKIVDFHARQGVQLLVFPEYAGLEVLSFTSLDALPELLPSYIKLFQELSCLYKMLICAGGQVVMTEEGTFNRSYFFAPNGKMSYQDKCILTPYEVNEGLMIAGLGQRVFETEFGKIGICICYDSEFPRLVKNLTEQGAQLILVPSYTSSVHGFYRVFLSCRAVALENQCYVVQSAIVGQTDVEMAYGSSAICTPVNEGFAEDGLLALGERDKEGFVVAELDFKKLEKVRLQGQTRNFVDAQLLKRRKLQFEHIDLR